MPAGWSLPLKSLVFGDVDGRLGDRPLLWRARTTSLRALYGFGYGVYSFIWGLQEPSMWLATCLLGAAGFCIYGPQALVGIAAANIATKKAAATAVGFTGLFGYASTLVSGWGLGLLAQHYGWDVAVGALILIAVVGTLIFMAAWTAKANGYDEGN